MLKLSFFRGRCAGIPKNWRLLAYLKLGLTHPFLRCFSVFYFSGLFLVCLFFSHRCTSAIVFCYRSYYATELLGAISVSNQKNQNNSTINQLTHQMWTSLCPICLCIVTSDLNLGLSLSAQIVSSFRQGLYPVFVEGNELLIPVSCYYQQPYNGSIFLHNFNNRITKL